MDRTNSPHLVNKGCMGRHCISCNVDEVLVRDAVVCPRCNHVYPSEQHLVADYLGEEVEVIEGIWEAFQKVRTMYCPRCLHFWGDREKN
jgi:hypothetical protein